MPVWKSSAKMTSSTSGMLSRAPIVAPSRKRRPPSKKPTNGYPPFHHGPQLSSSATANHCFRPSGTLIRLTRLSSNCRLQRQYSPCLNHSLSCGFSRPPPIQHERMKEVLTSPPHQQAETSVAKTERTDLARMRSGHHPAFRRWQHLVGIYEDAVCRLCGEEVESAEHLWLRCSALLAE